MLYAVIANPFITTFITLEIMSGQHEIERLKMEINGQPYYVKSKGNVPYLYDIDTHDEVGYWSSKKGEYIMFSLYNKLMKEKYESEGETREETSCSAGESETVKEETHSESGTQEEECEEEEEEEGASVADEEEEEEKEEEEEEEEECEEEEAEEAEEEEECEEEEAEEAEEEEECEKESSLVKTKNRMNKYSLVFLFLILFVYLILQKEFQSIHFDFIFLILVNLLNTLQVFEYLNDE
jgi:hypothetical protein